MNKKVIFALLLLVLSAGTYIGVTKYMAQQKSPKHSVAAFVDDLTAGDTSAATKRLTDSFKEEKGPLLNDFLSNFSVSKDKVRLLREETIKDSLNTYPKDSDPRRFIYRIRFPDQQYDYETHIVVYKEGNTWKVDDLYGAYVQ